MWAITRGGFNQKFFNLPKNLSRPLMATSNVIRVSSPSYSTSSPNHAPFKRVGTHNGSFHCDEALGCFMIRLTDKFSNSEIIRTRDPKVSSLPLFSVWLPNIIAKLEEMEIMKWVFFGSKYVLLYKVSFIVVCYKRWL